MSGALVQPSGEAVSRPRGDGLYMWALAILIGVLAAFAVVAIRTLIDFFAFLAFNAPRGRLYSALTDLIWWKRLLAPIVGGAIVALLLRVGIWLGWGPAPRAYGLRDVIEHRRLRGAVRSTTLSLRDSFWSAIVTVVSLGWGGSAGREEAAAHAGASLAMLPGRLLGLDVPARRILLGMGVAAAISAALHAPIAGVFFTRELVLRNVRLPALGPVVLASVTAWLAARGQFDGRPVIAVPDIGDVPAAFFAGALVATPFLAFAAWGALAIWTRAPAMTASAFTRWHVPLWVAPFPGGILLGVVALAFPQVLSVGYEPLAAGLGGNYSAQLMPVLVLAKIAATAITLGFRWGGGPIAPSLFIGAMMGSTLGAALGLATPGPDDAQAFLGLVGMAVALAILLDAPLAAGLLVLELSGSIPAAAASLACAFIATLGVKRFAPPVADEAGEILRWR